MCPAVTSDCAPTLRRRRRWVVAVIALVVALVLLLAGIAIRGPWHGAPGGSAAGTAGGESDRGTGESRPSDSSASDHGDAAPSAPTEPEPGVATVPASLTDTQPLTLPQRVRLATGKIHLEEGRHYLVSFDLSTVKPESAPGVGMYLGVSFSCSGPGGSGLGSRGGTENLQPGKPVSMVNHLALTPSRTGAHSCSVLANAPYDDVAAAGTTIELHAEWTVQEIRGEAIDATAGAALPTAVPAGRSAIVLDHVSPVNELTRTSAYTTLHVTTCTGANGSREQGRTWCTPEGIDPGGSTVTTTLQIQALAADGSPCGDPTTIRRRDTIDKWIHHDVLALQQAASPPESACAEQIRTTVTVNNTGPAALAVHASNSSLVITQRTR